MSYRFGELMFTPTVKRIQEERGSRAAYARLEGSDASAGIRLTAPEADFIAARDSFYMATVSESGWPYVQHRGGPPGFLKVLDQQTLGFADYRGNRQYVSVGNLLNDNRVSLFLMHYPNRQRLKLLGRARSIDRLAETDLFTRIEDAYSAKIERGVIIAVEAFDWNCPQHITPRHTESELVDLLAPVREELRALRAENAALHARLGTSSS